MAVYKRGETYHYEFEYRGARLRGSTGCTSRREAKSSSAPSGKRRLKSTNVVKLSDGGR